MFYYFLVELLIWYDTTKFHGHWPSNREVTQMGRGDGIGLPWPLPDSEQPGLFGVKGIFISGIHCLILHRKGKFLVKKRLSQGKLCIMNTPFEFQP